jgi:hypothetical protein
LGSVRIAGGGATAATPTTLAGAGAEVFAAATLAPVAPWTDDTGVPAARLGGEELGGAFDAVVELCTSA